VGDEIAWWKGVNIDPVPVALALWRQTRLRTAEAPPTIDLGLTSGGAMAGGDSVSLEPSSELNGEQLEKKYRAAI
jgi:hypothetical protein